MSEVISAEPRLVPAAEILDRDQPAGSLVRFDRSPVAPPQAHLVARERQVTGCRQRAIATAQNGDFHLLSAPSPARPRSL